MGLPRDLLVTRQGWLNDQVLIATVEDSVTIWGPDEAVDGLASLDDLGAKHATTRPSLDLAILASCGQCALIAPFHANDCSHVRLADTFLDASRTTHKLEGAIRASQREYFLVAFARQPVHGKYRCVDIHHFLLL